MRDIFKTTPLTPPEKSNLLMWHGGYQGGRVFHNDGTDYVDCGRPAFLNQLNPTVDEFTVRFSFKTTSTNQMYLFGLGPVAPSNERQLGVRVNNVVGDQQLSISIGGDYKNSGVIANLLDGKVKNCVLKVTTTNIYLFVNNAFIFSTAFTGSNTSTNNLMIGTLDSTSPASFNFQGDTCCLEFYSGVGDTASASLIGLTLLDSYNFGDPSQWNGGSSGTSLNGNAFTVTDGAPTGAGDYAYSKELFTDNYAMYQYSTGNINPNPTGDSTLTGLGFTNSYMTKASLSALHNGTTIFVSDASATLFRMLVYSALTDTQKALDYVRR